MSGVVNKLVTDNSVQLVGAVPGASFASVNILISNLTAVAAENVRIWIGTSANPTDVDVVEPAAEVPAYGRYEATGRICSTGEKVFVRAPVGCTVRLEAVSEI